MDWNLVWKAVIIVLGGTFLLRIAGRKSISQMTLAQTVIMIGIGSLLIQPIAGENIWTTLLVGFILVLTLVLMEFFQIKVDGAEKLITGKSKILIRKGQLVESNLKKLRITVDQLEMNLRKQGVERIEDVEWATLEPNGQVAMVLNEELRPVTKKEFRELQTLLEHTLHHLNIQSELPEKQAVPPELQETIFAEVNRKSHKNKPPKHLN